MTKYEIKNILLSAAHYIGTTNHCRKQMLKRNVNMDDILKIVREGNITNIKENPDHNNWECKVSGKDYDNEKLTAIVAVNKGENSIIITVF